MVKQQEDLELNRLAFDGTLFIFVFFTLYSVLEVVLEALLNYFAEQHKTKHTLHLVWQITFGVTQLIYLVVEICYAHIL
jgi:hypothetical protein